MEFKKMTKAHYPACAAELMAAFAGEPWEEDWTFEQALERIEGMMSAPVSRGYVAEEDGKVVGMLCGRVMVYLANKELHIDEFSIHPAYQGKGVGSAFLAYVKEQAKAEGIALMALNTGRDFPAMYFYEKNGFAEHPLNVFMGCWLK